MKNVMNIDPSNCYHHHYVLIKSKLQHLPSDPCKPWAFEFLLCPGRGEFDGGPCQGGEFALCLGRLGKIELFQIIVFFPFSNSTVKVILTV